MIKGDKRGSFPGSICHPFQGQHHSELHADLLGRVRRLGTPVEELIKCLSPSRCYSKLI